MSALIHPPVADYYLASYGKNASLGSFQTETAIALKRGEGVVLRTSRGLEVGTVVGPASVQQSRLIGHAGTLLRRLSEADERRLAEMRQRSERLFEQARQQAQATGLALEVIDVDVPFDGVEIHLVVIAADSVDAAPLVDDLEETFGLRISLLNLAATPVAAAEPEEAGCGKPDCGQGEGGCSSGGCSTGGCSTGCGSKDVDLRPYFSHLREEMQAHGRVPLA